MTQGEVIAALLKQHGLSVSELARRSGIDRAALTKIKNDQMGLGPDRAALIAAAVGVQVSEVLLPAAKDVDSRSMIGRRLEELEGRSDRIEIVLLRILRALEQAGIAVQEDTAGDRSRPSVPQRKREA